MRCGACGRESERADICTRCGRLMRPAEQMPQGGGPESGPLGVGGDAPTSDYAGVPAEPAFPSYETAPQMPGAEAYPPALEGRPRRNTARLVRLALVGTGCALLLTAALSAVVQKSQQTMRNVGSWRTYTSREDLFSIEAPARWKTAERSFMSAQTHAWIQQSPSIRVEVDASLVTSMMGKMAHLLDEDPTAPPGDSSVETPTEVTHRITRSTFSKLVGGADYTETAPQRVWLGGREAVVSDCRFRGKGFLWRPMMKGKRVTVLDKYRAYVILAACPEKEYPEFEPVMLRMLNSFQPTSRRPHLPIPGFDGALF